MSTLYNRRRGASARKMRKPRQCVQIVDTFYTRADGSVPSHANEITHERSATCTRLAIRNRYCEEHQR